VAGKMPFREAHGLVGKIVMRASELGKTLEELPLREYQSFSPLFEADLYPCLKLERALSRRTERGGTAPIAVKKSIRQFRKRIQDAT
jgi:argininosuccinate lyase